VHADLDTLVTALYVTIDDPFGPRTPPGRPPRLSDSELVCLAVAQVLLGCNSERRWLRFATNRMGHLFHYLPTPSAYNKRLRRAGMLVALAMCAPTWHDSLRLLDSTPLPCAASRQAVKRSERWLYAGYGYCASHHRYFWGFRLYLVAGADGLPIAWCLATPKLGEREVAQALLDHQDHLVQHGWIVLGDKGFAGTDHDVTPPVWRSTGTSAGSVKRTV
jgi:hypothetical protein